MKSVALYRPRDTWVHQAVDPFTKLVYLACATVSAFFVPTLFGAFAMILIHLMILWFARELGRAAKTVIASLVLFSTIFAIQGMFYPQNHTLVLQVGFLRFYQEGLEFAGSISLRIVNVITASSVLILTTSPADLMEACVRRGLSPKVGYIFTSILQVIPMMMSSISAIREAQQSRGMRVDGSVWHRFKAYVPLLGPLILSSLVVIQERAMSLEVRGFTVKTKKTFYKAEHVSWFMIPTRAMLVACAVATMVWGLRS